MKLVERFLVIPQCLQREWLAFSHPLVQLLCYQLARDGLVVKLPSTPLRHQRLHKQILRRVSVDSFQLEIVRRLADLGRRQLRGQRVYFGLDCGLSESVVFSRSLLHFQLI